MDAMLRGGAQWAVERGWGTEEDLERIEERGRMAGADPAQVSDQAKRRQRDEMGTLGSGNHYLEVQEVEQIFDRSAADAFDLEPGAVVISIHCGSRGLGHQIGTEFLKQMALDARGRGLHLPDRELACAPINSELGSSYLGAMRSAINCALANRQILTHLTRARVCETFCRTRVSRCSTTCRTTRAKWKRTLWTGRRGSSSCIARAPPALSVRATPICLKRCAKLVSRFSSVARMGTASYVLCGTARSEQQAFSSACHGAGRAMSRSEALRRYKGRSVVEELASRGILIRSPSMRGVAEEAPGAYKDVSAVVEAADRAGLARRWLG